MDFTELAKEFKGRVSEELGKNFHKLDEIKIIEKSVNEFVVRADYEKSNKNKDSLKDEYLFSVILEDGKYYLIPE